jgi:hypothetical protein
MESNYFHYKIKVFFVLTILLISVIFENCNTENKNPDETFRNQAILSYLILPKYNAITSCKLAYDESEKCLGESLQFPLPIVNETTLSTVFSSGKLTNYKDLCESTRTSNTFKNFTDQAFACNFNCQTEYWKSLYTNNLSTCFTRTFVSLWNESLNDKGLVKCIQSCYRVTGNTSISTTEKELLILYSNL